MRRAATLFSRGGIAGMIGLVALTACTVVVDEDRPGPVPPRGPQFCTREYQPVCARRGPDRRTFGNPCMADAAGYRIVHPGQCGPGGPGPGPGFCTREYQPVCARRGPQMRTFGNACEAESAGFRIVDDGPC